jgi:patatin-like phospholipase/acyl hydrolase
MVAGTSTGGIIALGLGAGRSASEVLDIYLRKGKSIFPRASRFGVFGPAFSPDALRGVLVDALGDRLFGDSGVRLCIPSCEARHGDINVFKTPHHPDFRKDWKQPMVEVGMATSAAPTFLPAHTFGGFTYLDGGLWANNPVMVGLVDAITCFDVAPQNVRVLSISPGSKVPALADRQLGGAVGWIGSGALTESFMHYSALNADGQASLLIGRERLKRVVAEPPAAGLGMTDFDQAKAVAVPAGVAAAAALSDIDVEAFFRSPADGPIFYHGPRARSERGS